MKISFWIPATVLYVASIAFSRSVQVGTVLFAKTDLGRRCWTENEKSLLKARLTMQDILPDPQSIDFSNPKAALVLLDYFLACFEIINKFCDEKVQDLMYIALSDALGGYWRAYVMPSAKRAYYAGQLNYKEAAQIFRLHDHIKIFLKTNGKGWAKPRKLSRRNFRASPLVITGGSYEACKNLRIIEKAGKLCHYGQSSELNAVEFTTTVQPDVKTDNCSVTNFKNSKKPNSTNPTSPNPNSTCPKHRKQSNKKWRRKKKLNFNSAANSSFEKVVSAPENETRELPVDSEIPRRKRDRCQREDYEDSANENGSKTVIVPLPILDDYQNPHSIAVPFKNRPLRNLHSASSAYILEYYYTTVIKCLIAAGSTKADIKNFNEEFHSWLVSQVLPHLNKDQWYPGFGGVLRIVETIKKFGVAPGFTESGFHDSSYLFGKGVEFELQEGKGGRYKPRNIIKDSYPNTRRHVITAILVVSLLWMFLFCACAFYTQATRRCRPVGASSNSSKYMEHEFRFSSHSNPQRSAPAKKASKTMCFQFFVKFFRKPNENNQFKDQENQVYWNIIKLNNKNQLKKNLGKREGKNPYETLIKKDLTLNLIKGNQGQGDAGLLRQEEFFKPILPHWPSQHSLPKNKIKVVPETPVELNQPQKQPEKVTLLWKKPSIKVNKKDKRRAAFNKILKVKSNSTSESCSSSYTTSVEAVKKKVRKESICSCCSESCQQTSTTYTNRSSRSKLIFQMKRILTSTTLEYFKNVKAKHKPIIKRVIMASTEESECDDEGSTSYEGDY